MPHETRPRREPAGNPRPPRKPAPGEGPPANRDGDEPAGYPAADHLPAHGPTSPGDYRAYGERVPYRGDDRAADRAERAPDRNERVPDRSERVPRGDRERDVPPPSPLSAHRDRVDRAPDRNDRAERGESASSALRERLARDRAERLARQHGGPGTPAGPPPSHREAAHPVHDHDPRLDDDDEPLEDRNSAYEPPDDDDIFGDAEIHDRYEDIKRGEIHLTELQKMTMPQLLATAKKEGVTEYTGLKKQDLIFKILKERVKQNGLMYGEGTLEVLPDGFGFLRSPDYNYLPCPDDIYVSPSQIRRFGLKTGAIVAGQIRPPKENERYFALLRVEAINFEDPDKLSEKVSFDDLTSLHPESRIKLEHDGDLTLRVIDLLAPIGKGQRGLIVAPPRSGKSFLLQKLASAILANQAGVYLIVLLVDERPEEVTAMEQAVKAINAEVISSTFDEPPARHIQIAEMVIDKARRMVEYGRDVVILLDSVSRLARAYNTELSHAGKILNGSIDSSSLQKPKRFLAAARRVEDAGSLTILATIQVDTGSRLDELIHEEFQGTANMELVLDRQLAERRVWPAINARQTGTRREELLVDPELQPNLWRLRSTLSALDNADAITRLTRDLNASESNEAYLRGLAAEPLAK